MNDTTTRPPRSTNPIRSRLLRHYAPIAVASVAALVVLMNVPFFDANRYPPPADIFVEGAKGALPGGDYPPQGQAAVGGHATGEPGASPAASPTTGPNSTGSGTAGDHTGPPAGGHGPAQPGAPEQPDRSGDTTLPAVGQSSQAAQADHGNDESILLLRRYSTATGYIALGLLAVTLLIGPANLALRRRTPISSYVRRDLGVATATTSAVHVVFGFLVKHGDGQILGYFFQAGDRTRILTNSFGLANWAGLAGLVLVGGLAAISSDRALRKLKAKRWKRYQRSTYLLFVLVVLHSVLYGALWRLTSPYTVLLLIAVAVVVAGQLLGKRTWRRRANAAGAPEPARP
jgi:sulfoxide reductase heme-binding subunit YedZ